MLVAATVLLWNGIATGAQLKFGSSPGQAADVHRTCQLLQKGNQAVQACALRGDGLWQVALDEEGPHCAATATFIDSAQTTSNFGKLRVVTGGDGYTDQEQAYAAGFVEGFLTAARIFDHFSNLKAYFNTMLNETEMVEKSLDWLEVQEAWVNEQLKSAPADEPYWRLIGLVQRQFDGLVDGYQARAKQEQGQEQRLQQQVAAGQQGGVKGGRRMAAGGGEGSGNEDVAVGWLERRDLMFLNSNGDVYDIMDALEAGYGYGDDSDGDESGRGSSSSSSSSSSSGVGAARRGRRHPAAADIDESPLRMSLKLGLQGKCSALIKVTGDLGDLLVGHSTHDSFTAMTRIYKHYDFASLADDAIAARRVSFSSYPGELFSDDDFYLLSSGLMVLETTNHIYVGDVYKPLTPHCVLSWQRIRLANWMAASGEEWVDVFGRFNSGTYNNQYMVLNFNRFVPGKELQPGLLWVVEQLPDVFLNADMTQELARGYWPSYNVAYFPEVYEAAGYPDMIARLEAKGAKKYGFAIRLLKYQIAPRASIFRRDQGAVSNLDGLKKMMRYNDWQKDPIADGNPVGAVCARGDLAPGKDGLAKGCYDSKVTNAAMALRMESEVVGGPTAQGQTPFSWTDPRWVSLPHRGMPDTFDFAFERMTPKDLPTTPECTAAAKAVAADAAAGASTSRKAHLQQLHAGDGGQAASTA
ncbi:hypothetical protein HYH02_006919 [Chlamydomonas schloesseri]|uniref:Phospholipase B-like n=1 Tax=Chlamydomonas schloesseri TaxID=2026947 RepID=A0A835WJ49_9CHLO|nr:hypothetical protein HYH02_006919 [Chlamydomonas schloesseri]|eukprot:KAG2448337.1 hypothetical protein HYH02_006919 [Chlamydomonas schloesseri]